MKIKFVNIIAFVFGLCSCHNVDNNQKPAADTSTKTASPPDTVKLLMVGSAQIMPYKTIHIGGIAFELVTDDRNDTSFLATSDKNFVTPEGYRIGMSLKQIKKEHRNNMKVDMGWGYFVKLPSQWNLQFVVGQSFTDHEPVDTNKVVYIFKKH